MANLPKVTFLNQPKLSEHFVDQKFNESRSSLVPQIEEFIIGNDLFKNEKVDVSFFHDGASSLVSLLETINKKYILKIALRVNTYSNGEVLFLKAWEDIGVPVPHIYDSGVINEHSYILMNYIDAKTLDKAYTEKELLDKKIFFQMGQTLSKMNSVQVKGYGKITESGTGEYAEFKDWIFENPQTKNQLKYVKENNLLPEGTYGSVEEAIQTLISYIQLNFQSVYCHYDFSPGNVFNTEPLTIFDPVPIFNNPYLDIGKSVVQTLAYYPSHEVSEQLVSGYFSGNTETLNTKVLQASILFIAHTKFKYWHQTNKMQCIENVKNYLEVNITK